MQGGAILLVCCLLAQSDGDTTKGEIEKKPAAAKPPVKGRTPASAAPTDAEAAGKLSARDQGRQKHARNLADGLFLPGEAGPAGAPKSLRDVIARLAYSDQQRRAVTAYWSLSASLADYRIAYAEHLRLNELTDGKAQKDAPELTAALASVVAAMRETEIDVADAQASLAVEMGLPADEKFLPDDPPLVVVYNHRVDKNFSGRTIPAFIRRAADALPRHHAAILARAGAVQASAEAADGETELAKSIQAIAELSEQQRAFVRAVKSYNVEIANYVLAVVPPGQRPDVLVASLISKRARPKIQPKDASSAIVDDSVETATFEQDEPPAADEVEDNALDGAATEEPENGAASTAGDTGAAEEHTAEKPVVPDDGLKLGDARGSEIGESPAARQMTAMRATIDPGPLYADLYKQKGPVQARRLTEALHSQSVPQGTQVSLGRLLAGISPFERRRAIQAYWAACETQARHALLETELARLQALSADVALLAKSPGGIGASLRWNGRVEAAKADLADAEREMAAARFTLAELLGAPLTGDLPVASTVPYAGKYRTELEALSPDVRGVLGVQRRAEAIAEFVELVRDRAAAVIAADAAYSTAQKNSPASVDELDAVLRAVKMQAAETRRLLRDVTQYNMQIANYALAVLPPNLPAPQLVQALAAPDSPPPKPADKNRPATSP